MNRIRALSIAAAIAACGIGAVLADPVTVYSEAKGLGEGFAQVYAELDAEGAPRVIGVSFDQGMLAGLPTMPNAWSRCFDKNENGRIDGHGECNGDFELQFELPQELVQRGVTPFRWVSINWNPMGHPPPAPPVWAVPHADFHFYIMAREAVRQIRPGPCSELIDCADFERAQIPVPAGYYDGHVTFYEPMVTLAYLQTRPDSCVPIKQPQAWETEGYYPTTYCIRYLADDERYTVSLEDFIRRAAD
jgi:hypothetical protein